MVLSGRGMLDGGADDVGLWLGMQDFLVFCESAMYATCPLCGLFSDSPKEGRSGGGGGSEGQRTDSRLQLPTTSIVDSPGKRSLCVRASDGAGERDAGRAAAAPVRERLWLLRLCQHPRPLLQVLPRQPPPDRDVPGAVVIVVHGASRRGTVPEGIPVDEGAMPPPPPPRAKTKSRCAACGRRVGLMGFECRCGAVFCGAHPLLGQARLWLRLQGRAGRDAIARANPVVSADKVDKL
ncbi:hypothetical protein [Oryza sativa Japonica Group]|uniref:Zinc finger AN1 domain-containing stress-associated protein 13 n=2 Tax=Oryza TaxID=4527 RepID=SAP13_ORYSJ|nr:RecName: Full=Zinc finger AN1 domain-containing stress-associated protein 13; Short=OsSAP13 [Oryza sativa Japonica Group]KAF2952009.1 hypothetical protein DAI22_01g303800 [Oryza sativa Japonica Group]BAD87392.1 hypothetical protein [Oryza sativa Japonica Group]BAD87750.1 hypothetical protein [Oryza sativa Japonica Group]